MTIMCAINDVLGTELLDVIKMAVLNYTKADVYRLECECL